MSLKRQRKFCFTNILEKHVTFEAMVGSQLHNAIDEALEYANDAPKTPVTLIFNEVKLQIWPKESSHEIEKQYYRKLNEVQR